MKSSFFFEVGVLWEEASFFLKKKKKLGFFEEGVSILREGFLSKEFVFFLKMLFFWRWCLSFFKVFFWVGFFFVRRVFLFFVFFEEGVCLFKRVCFQEYVFLQSGCLLFFGWKSFFFRRAFFQGVFL